MTTFNRASEQPVGAAQDNWLYPSLTSVVGNINVGSICVETECIPTIEGVGYRVREFGFRRFLLIVFVKPCLEKRKLWFSNSLAQVFAFHGREAFCYSFYIKQTFNYSHWKFCFDGIGKPGIFEVAMNVSPAVGRSRTGSNYSIEFVRAVRQKNTLKAFEDFLSVHGMLSLRKIVNSEGAGAIAKHRPDESFLGFAKAPLDHRHCGGIGHDYFAFQEKDFHSAYDWFENLGAPSHPSAHGGAVNGYAERLKDFFLSVKRQVEKKFVCNYFGQQPWPGLTFVNWLIWFFCCEYVLAAFLAAVFVGNMFDFFEDRLDEINLRGNVESENGSFLSAAWASKKFRIGNLMFFSAFVDTFF